MSMQTKPVGIPDAAFLSLSPPADQHKAKSEGSVGAKPGAKHADLRSDRVTVAEPDSQAPRGAVALPVGEAHTPVTAEATTPKPPNHPWRDARIPVAGQVGLWAGATALASEGVRYFGVMGGQAVDSKAFWAGAGVVAASGLGLIASFWAGGKQLDHIPKHAGDKPATRWARALAFGGLGAAAVAGAMGGDYKIEKKLQFEVADRRDIPKDSFPHENKYAFIDLYSKNPKGTPDDTQLRDYIYHGTPKSFESVVAIVNDVARTVESGAQRGLEEPVISFPPSSKTNSGDLTSGVGSAVSVVTTEGQSTPPVIQIKLAKVWGETFVSSLSEKNIPQKDRAQQSKWAAHTLRLLTHANLFRVYMNPDFLNGFQNQGNATDISQADLQASALQMLARLTFKHPQPGAAGKPAGYDEKALLARTFAPLGDTSKEYFTANASAGAQELPDILMSLFRNPGPENLFRGALGLEGDGETQAASKAVADAIPPINSQ
jgi:hypothetical protein